MKYVVFDIETTGLDTNNDSIVEIGAVKVIDGIVIDTFSKLINPGKPIPYAASSVNGITDEMVFDADLPGKVLYEFNQFIGDADFLLGHNAKRFDYPFVKSEFRRYFVKHNELEIKDTMWIARAKVKGIQSYSLKSLCSYFNVSNDDAHRALSDAMATYQIFEELQKR